MKIVKCEPIYSGGGIYIFFGQLDDGNFFIADNDNYDVTVIDADPWWPEEPLTANWQSDHLVNYLSEDVALLFFGYMIDWIEWHKPDGNYQLSELLRIREKAKERSGQ